MCYLQEEHKGNLAPLRDQNHGIWMSYQFNLDHEMHRKRCVVTRCTGNGA